MASKRLTRSTSPAGPSVGSALALCDLGPELLNVIFHKLGPSPMHLAALPSVCKAWRDIMQGETLPQLGLELAPALCEMMGYGASSQPPGGWLGFFKFLLYCPALHCSLIRRENVSCSDLPGHVQRIVSTFETGPAVAEYLQLRPRYQRDNLVVSEECEHILKDAFDSLGARRGLIQDFASSAIGEQSKANTYLKASPQEQQRMQESARESCTFCGVPLFELSGDAFFDNSRTPSGNPVFEEFISQLPVADIEMVTGHVCEYGHLTFATSGYDELNACIDSFLDQKPLAETGEQMRVETFKVFDAVVEALWAGPLGRKLDSESEAGLRNNMNAFTVALKIRRLANEIEYETSDEEDSLGGPHSLARLQTMPELISGIPEIARRVCTVINDFVDVGEDSSDSESESESEDEESEKVRPFWEVPVDEIETVMDLLAAVPGDAVGILATYLGRSTVSARTVVRTVRNLRRLYSTGEQATHRLGEMEAHRKAVIEGALEEAGVRKSSGAWPIPEAVYSFVKDPNRSLEEVVNCERQRWLEMKEERAADRAAQKREKAKRIAEHEARQAERKAQREEEKAAKCASRLASRGLIVCPGGANGTKCNNAGSGACVRLACGACCCTYATGGCPRHRR